MGPVRKHKLPPSLVLVMVPLLVGCTGRLEFDPHLVDASARDTRPSGLGGSPGAGSGSSTATGGGDGYPVTGGAGGARMGGGEPSPSAADARPADDAWMTGAAGGTGGGTALGGGGDGGLTPADTGMGPVASACPLGFDILDLFKRRCGGCHGATSPTKNLDLVTAGIGGRMVNKLSTCMGKPLISSQVAAGAAPTGLLFEKLAGPVTGCGVRMPAGGAPALTPVEIECVNDWAIAAINKALGK
ncbi:MAG TPA: hypothetical protein VFH73_09315 [Polyangia bacterium]|nr:hypothetical protein [Polyangia bacterium]